MALKNMCKKTTVSIYMHFSLISEKGFKFREIRLLILLIMAFAGITWLFVGECVCETDGNVNHFLCQSEEALPTRPWYSKTFDMQKTKWYLESLVIWLWRLPHTIYAKIWFRWQSYNRNLAQKSPKVFILAFFKTKFLL